MTTASNRTTRRHRGSALALCLLLAACATPPPAPPPEPPAVPAQFKQTGLWRRVDATNQGASAATPAAPVPERWWQLFKDPVLDSLQERLVIDNENLKSAVAQVAAARAALDGSRARQSPTLGLTGAATRADSNGNTAQTSLRVDASAAWELDLWGRLALATRASAARLQASEADLAAARLSAQTTLLQSYLVLRSAEAQQALIARSVLAYQRSLALTQARYQSGVVPSTDVLQARTQLRTAQVQGLEAANQRAQAEHAIAVLLGQAPAALTLDTTARLPAAPRVPELLPATLLQRRPDIAAASQRVAAAQALIGEAEAAYFPSLTLSASAGLRESTLSQLLRAPLRVWSLGPSLAQTLADGGARRAATAQARANAEQTTAQYRQTVLTALQEVEDNLVLADQLQTQAQWQREALSSAQRNLEITQEQYRVGTVSYLNVVTAQTAALGSERSLLDLQSRQLVAVNQLLKNIAGHW
jgi:NodT family efflux transporter outer membrane factor (OMF) lipoprotein